MKRRARYMFIFRDLVLEIAWEEGSVVETANTEVVVGRK